MSDVSSNCEASKSHITYKCRPGYKFENNEEYFRSICKYNKWENLPRCLPGFNLYKLNFKLKIINLFIS
jgi:hypothetical protein